MSQTFLKNLLSMRMNMIDHQRLLMKTERRWSWAYYMYKCTVNLKYSSNEYDLFIFENTSHVSKMLIFKFPVRSIIYAPKTKMC